MLAYHGWRPRAGCAGGGPGVGVVEHVLDLKVIISIQSVGVSERIVKPCKHHADIYVEKQKARDALNTP